MAYCWQELDNSCEYLLEFDGASRCDSYTGDKRAGAGAALFVWEDEWRQVGSVSTYLGDMTGNQAEYCALIIGLQAAYDAGVRVIEVTGDSNLVVKQLTGQWSIKSNRLYALYTIAHEAYSAFESSSIQHVYREYNGVADQLANQAVEGYDFEGMQDMEGDLIVESRGGLPPW